MHIVRSERNSKSTANCWSGGHCCSVIPSESTARPSSPQNEQPARFSFQQPLLQTFNVLLTSVSPGLLHAFMPRVQPAGSNLALVMPLILLLPTSMFLLSSQQCSLVLFWYTHSSQWAMWQPSRSTAADQQRPMSAPARSCHLLPSCVVPTLTQYLLHWHESGQSVQIIASELLTTNLVVILASVIPHPLHHAKFNPSRRSVNPQDLKLALLFIFLY